MPIDDPITQTAFRTGHQPGTVRLHAMSMTAHPARKTGGASGDQRIIRHIPCNGASGCNEGITADRNTADDRGIGSDCGAAAEKNGFIKGVAVDL